MLEYLRKNIANFFDDFGYNARAAITHAVGEGSIKGGSIFTGQALATTLSASTAAFPIAMIIGIPVCTGFSAALVQQDHLHRRFKLTQEFNQEIAAWLQRSGTAKKPGEVTDQDLDLAAYGDAKQGIPGNPSLAAALDHSRHERNWGVAISAVATAIATTLVFGLKAAEALPTFGALAALAGPLAVAAELMVAGAIGFAIYTATKVPMHWVAEQLFDLEKTTVVDRVRDIRRALEHGQKISETKVFEVFLEAHPELARAVRREHGRSFDSLSLKDQAQVAAAFGPSIHLRQLTADINSGAVRPEELAFTSYGQASGVAKNGLTHRLGLKLNVLERAWDASVATMHRWVRSRNDTQTSSALEVEAGVALSSHRTHAAQTSLEVFEAPLERATSFLHLTGKTPREKDEPFIARVPKRRTIQPAANFQEIVESSAPSEPGLQ